MLIKEWPRRDNDQECQRCASKPDVQRLVDILCGEADKEGDSTDDGKEAVGDVLGKTLTVEVLTGGQFK